jgi:hypothetical protein
MSTDPTAEADPAADPTADAEATMGAFDCPYCGRRFAREPWRDLHRGQEHGERLDAAEREAYEAAHDAEAEDIRMFRLKALAVLVLVYFGFLMVYAFTL